jgi:hypothetical protein
MACTCLKLDEGASDVSVTWTSRVVQKLDVEDFSIFLEVGVKKSLEVRIRKMCGQANVRAYMHTKH